MTARSALDLIVETTTTTGTGTITLAGAASGYLALPSAADGQTFGYSLEDANGTARETGTGVYTHSGRTFTRTPIASTNSNAAISLTSGTHTFRVCPLADLFTGLTGNVQTQIDALAVDNVTYATKTDTASTTSTTWADTGLQVTITPTSATSILQLTASAMFASTNWAYFRFLDNSGNPVLQGDASGSKAQTQTARFQSATGVGAYEVTIHAMHEPASTSALTYKLQWRINSVSGGTVYLNRGLSGEADTDTWPRAAAYMSVEEFRQ